MVNRKPCVPKFGSTKLSSFHGLTGSVDNLMGENRLLLIICTQFEAKITMPYDDHNIYQAINPQLKLLVIRSRLGPESEWYQCLLDISQGVIPRPNVPR